MSLAVGASLETSGKPWVSAINVRTCTGGRKLLTI